MAAYRRVYDSCHLQATAKNWDQLRNPTLGNRVWATFTVFFTVIYSVQYIQYIRYVHMLSHGEWGTFRTFTDLLNMNLRRKKIEVYCLPSGTH